LRPLLHSDERKIEQDLTTRSGRGTTLQSWGLMLLDRLSKSRQELLEVHEQVGGVFKQVQRGGLAFASVFPDRAVGEVVDQLLEAKAEIAAYQGLVAGGLPGWVYETDWERPLDPMGSDKKARWLYLVRDGMRYEWRVVTRGTFSDRERLAIGYADTPRAAMRAADCKARELGWLP
jgi:hypothetical protein